MEKKFNQAFAWFSVSFSFQLVLNFLLFAAQDHDIRADNLFSSTIGHFTVDFKAADSRLLVHRVADHLMTPTTSWFAEEEAPLNKQ
jgi:hypothetical protein